ncbi:hypothetical protein [Microbacterium sp. SLBN-111]|uniref:hypothetical protein n=1 Tax=Microbacterium sp. SLBN-111 TaxID=3377733 RepID=UPI003C75A973
MELRAQGARLETRHRVRSVATESAPRAPAAMVTIARPGERATARIVLAVTAIRARRVATVDRAAETPVLFVVPATAPSARVAMGTSVPVGMATPLVARVVTATSARVATVTRLVARVVTATSARVATVTRLVARVVTATSARVATVTRLVARVAMETSARAATATRVRDGRRPATRVPTALVPRAETGVPRVTDVRAPGHPVASTARRVVRLGPRRISVSVDRSSPRTSLPGIFRAQRAMS